MSSSELPTHNLSVTIRVDDGQLGAKSHCTDADDKVEILSVLLATTLSNPDIRKHGLTILRQATALVEKVNDLQHDADAPEGPVLGQMGYEDIQRRALWQTAKSIESSYRCAK